jgi:chromosomal replication initiator protein
MDALRQSMLRAQLARPLAGSKRPGGSQSASDARASDMIAIDARVSALDKKLDALIRMFQRPGDDPRASRALLVTDVRRVVAKFFDVTDEDLDHRGRATRISRIRQIAFYLCRTHTTRSFPEIGRDFQRDHSTVLHGVRRIEALRGRDPELDADLSKLEKRLAEIFARRNAACLEEPSAQERSPS